MSKKSPNNKVIKVQTQINKNGETFFVTPKKETYKELNDILNGANKTNTYDKKEAENIRAVFGTISEEYDKKSNIKFIQAQDYNYYLLSGKDIKKTKDAASYANGANLNLTFNLKNNKEKLNHVSYEHYHTTYHPSQDGFSSEKEICTKVDESYPHVYYTSVESDI